MSEFIDHTLTRSFLQQVTATWPLSDSPVEVRAINVQARDHQPLSSGRLPIYTGLYADVDELTNALAQFDQQFIASGTHFTINPRKRSFGVVTNRPLESAHSTTSDADIDSLRTVVIDIDPKRPSKCSSTEEERERALDCALTIATELGEFSFPEPLRVMSGNGYHLYYGINLPIDQKSMVQSFLQAVSQRFSSDLIDIDTTVGNPSRIMKLPGTWARKGENTEERPHRMAVWENTDIQLGHVTQDQVQTVIEKWHKSPERRTASHISSGGYTLASLQASALHDLEAIESNCSFMAYCRDHPADLAEPQWFSQMSIIAHCEDSQQLALDRSSGHPGFDPDDTERKRLHVLNNGGPHTCQHIEDSHGHEGCASCPLRGVIKSPINADRDQRQDRQARPPGDEEDLPLYRVDEHGIHLRVGRNDNLSYERIANFSGKLIKQIEYVDDDAQGRGYELDIQLKGQTRQVTVPAGEFEKLDWVPEQLGADAWMTASPSKRREIPSIIQQQSLGSVEDERVYTSTGWVKHEGEDVFVHADGGLTRDGLRPDLRVQLPTQLDKVCLESPGGDQHDQLHQALTNLFQGLPEELLYPLLGSIAAAPLSIHFSMHISGQTGSFKSEVSALAMSFFGRKFRRQSLPESWSSTANALVRCAHHARDILMVIDDFKPATGRYARQQQSDIFDRVIRSTANQSDRSRLSRTSQLQQQYFPRGFVLSTGEELPAGQSMNARLWEGRLKPGLISGEDLTRMQEAAHAGYYCQLMSGFIQWLAHDLEGARERMHQQMTAYRQQLQQVPGHPQSKEVAASLLAALETFLQYLVNAQFINTADLTQHLEKAHQVFAQGMQRMAAQVAEEDPVQLFQQLLVGGLLSQSIMLGYADQRRDSQDSDDETIHARLVDSQSRALSRAQMIGYDTKQDVIYLLPDQTMKAVQEMLPDGQTLPGKNELVRRLYEKGFLAEHDMDSPRSTHAVRRTIADKRITVWAIRREFIADTQAKQEKGVDQRRLQFRQSA